MKVQLSTVFQKSIASVVQCMLAQSRKASAKGEISEGWMNGENQC